MRTLADALLAALPRKLPARTHLLLALTLVAYEPRLVRVSRSMRKLLAAMQELDDAQEELELAAAGGFVVAGGAWTSFPPGGTY